MNEEGGEGRRRASVEQAIIQVVIVRDISKVLGRKTLAPSTSSRNEYLCLVIAYHRAELLLIMLDACLPVS